MTKLEVGKTKKDPAFEYLHIVLAIYSLNNVQCGQSMMLHISRIRYSMELFAMF